MGESAYGNPALPAVPSVETSFDVPGPFRPWFHHGAPHAGLILAVSPVALIALLFVMGHLSNTSNSISFLAPFALGVFAILVTDVLCLATLRSRRAQRRQLREDAAELLPRLQSAKDWYIRGDITEGEFDQLRALIESSTSPAAPHRAAQSVAVTLRSFFLLAAALAPLLVPINLVLMDGLFGYGEGLLLVVTFLVIDGLTIGLLVTAWRTSAHARRAHGLLQEASRRSIDALEHEVMQTARTRGRGGARAPPSGAGPSFRSYSARV